MDFPFVVYRMFDSRGGESQISTWNADIIGGCVRLSVRNARWRGLKLAVPHVQPDSLAGKDLVNLEKVINAFGIASGKAQVGVTTSPST